MQAGFFSILHDGRKKTLENWLKIKEKKINRGEIVPLSITMELVLWPRAKRQMTNEVTFSFQSSATHSKKKMIKKLFLLFVFSRWSSRSKVMTERSQTGLQNRTSIQPLFDPKYTVPYSNGTTERKNWWKGQIFSRARKERHAPELFFCCFQNWSGMLSVNSFGPMFTLSEMSELIDKVNRLECQLGLSSQFVVRRGPFLALEFLSTAVYRLLRGTFFLCSFTSCLFTNQSLFWI